MGFSIIGFYILASNLVKNTQNMHHLSLELLHPLTVLSLFELILTLQNHLFKLIQVIEDILPIRRAVLILEIGGCTDEERVRVGLFILQKLYDLIEHCQAITLIM